MRLDSLNPLRWAARSAVASVAVLIGFAFAPAVLAQEEPAAEEAAPAEAAPAEPVESIPVEPTDAVEEEIPAEESSATELDSIEVTGSRIKRTDYETAQPVAIVTRADIERTGLTNLGDILQRIPAAGSALNRNFNNGGNGQTEIDLRNLGSNRVLVLVNGHRWVAGTSLGDSAVDLNTIPVSVIERIEVLKDGASAIYGSDAITGVVNVITRKDFSGVEIGSQAQSFSDGKGLVQAHHISFGNITGKTSMFVDFNFVNQSELFAGDRDEAATPQDGTSIVMSGVNYTDELVHTRGSAIGPEGYFIWVPTPDNSATLGDEKCPVLVGPQGLVGVDLGLPELEGVRLCQISPIRGEVINASDPLAVNAAKFRYNGSIFGVPDPYQHNFAPINYLLTPFSQNSVFTQINHQFLDWLNFNSQVLYNVSQADQALAEEPLRVGDLFAPPQSQAYIAADNIYNPFAQDIGRADTAAGLIGLGAAVRRMIEAGPRFAGRTNTTLFFKNQFDGSFDFISRLFSYDVGYSHGQNDQATDITGAFNMERVAAAVGPSARCPSPDNPLCVPFNFFAPVGGITQEMLDYVMYTASSTAESQVQDVYGNVSTEFDELSGLLPGNWLVAPIGVAFGVEYRDERFKENPDPYSVQGISSNLNGAPTNGAYNVKEAYMELAIPIVSDIFLADELDLSLAGRYTEYNTFDPKTTGKIGLRWKPYEDLLVRSTYSQAFRAPNLLELFLGTTESFPALDDPCAATDAAGNAAPRQDGTAVDENCDEEGVPDQPQTQAQTHTTFQGNKNLDAETADTLTAGFVYSPSFVPDLNIYIDYFSIELVDFIAFVDAEYILESCYERPSNVGRPATCDLIERDPNTGLLTNIAQAPINFAILETSGVDIAFDYILPIAQFFPAAAAWGSFKFSMDSQYLDKYNQTVPAADGSPQTDALAGRDGGDQPLPRFKANSTLEWARDNWKAAWMMRFIKGTTEDCNDGLAPSLASLGLCSDPDSDLTDGLDDSENTYKDILYHNAQVVYNLPTWSTELTLGVNNIFDQDPPWSASAFANSAPATVYETWGSRMPYLKLNVGF